MTDQPDIEAIAKRHAEKGGKCAVCIELTPPGLRFAYLDWPCDTAIVIERLRAVDDEYESAVASIAYVRRERDRWREDAGKLAEALTDALAGTNLAGPLQKSHRNIFTDQGTSMAEWLTERGYALADPNEVREMTDGELSVIHHPEQERLAAIGARLRDDSEGTIYGTIWDWLGEQRRSIYMMRDIENMTKGVILYRAAIDAALEDK